MASDVINFTISAPRRHLYASTFLRNAFSGDNISRARTCTYTCTRTLHEVFHEGQRISRWTLGNLTVFLSIKKKFNRMNENETFRYCYLLKNLIVHWYNWPTVIILLNESRCNAISIDISIDTISVINIIDLSHPTDGWRTPDRLVCGGVNRVRTRRTNVVTDVESYGITWRTSISPSS